MGENTTRLLSIFSDVFEYILQLSTKTCLKKIPLCILFAPVLSFKTDVGLVIVHKFLVRVRMVPHELADNFSRPLIISLGLLLTLPKDSATVSDVKEKLSKG